MELIGRRDKALYKLKIDNSPEARREYNLLRHATQNAINKAKRDHVKNEIEENSGCFKKLWKTPKSLGLSSKGSASNAKIGLKDDDDDDDCIEFEGKAVADRFNNFFCSVASKLVAKLHKRYFNKDRLDQFYYNLGVTQKSFCFSIVTEQEVLKMLKGLNVSKSTDHDDISANFLRDGAN